MLRAVTLALLVLPAICLPGCISIDVTVEADAQRDIAAYRTWGWMPKPGAPKGIANEIPIVVDSRIREAIREQLARRGVRQAGGEGADCLVRYHAALTESLDLTEISQTFGYDYPADWSSGGAVFNVGTLVLDIVDSETRELAWRGAADGVIDSQAEEAHRQQHIHEGVAKLLRVYPGDGR